MTDWLQTGQNVQARGQDILAALRADLPKESGSALSDPREHQPLWAEELLPGASNARITEFSAGRAAARAALSQLGVAPCALLHGPDRVPCWPVGFVGSITHTSEFCLAAVLPARAEHGIGIGIDLEPATPLEKMLWPMVLRPEEIASAETVAGEVPGVFAKKIFVAKEAAFKAQYCLSRATFTFDRLSVVFHADRFDAVFTRNTPPFKTGDDFSGRIRHVLGQFLATVVI